MKMVSERRQYERVKFDRPIPARYGEARVFVIDVSLNGAWIAHQGDISEQGESRLTFEWHGNTISYACSVVRTVLSRPPAPPSNKPLYHSGINLLRSFSGSSGHLRALITEHVMRALDERKANARGIPPIAATFQSGRREALFVCCRFIRNAWTKTQTRSADQPLDGFTISAQEDEAQIEMLCRSYEEADIAGRKMIRTMAEMSICDSEIVPTRRYSP